MACTIYNFVQNINIFFTAWDFATIAKTEKIIDQNMD